MRRRTPPLATGAEPRPTTPTILRRWFDLILKHQDDLAKIIGWEMGKPVAAARSPMAAYFEWFVEQIKRADGEIIPCPCRAAR